MKNFKWKIVLKKEVKVKTTKKAVSLKLNNHNVTFQNEVLLLILQKIISDDFYLNLDGSLPLILKKLFSSGFLVAILIHNKKEILITNNFIKIPLPLKIIKKELNDHTYIRYIKGKLSIFSALNQNFLNICQKSNLEFLTKKNNSLEEKILIFLIQENRFTTNSKNGTWEFHETLFHHQTFQNNLSEVSLKNIIKLTNKKSISLPKNDLIKIERSSNRSFSNKALPLSKLASILGTLGKNKQYNHPFYGKHRRRQYPSAGAAYENEFYYLATNTQGLAKGLYYYNGDGHILESIEISEQDLSYLNAIHMNAIKSDSRLPGGIIFITSKLPVLHKKYSKISYRLTLLNAGVITAYLDIIVAKLKIGGCPVGSTDGNFFGKKIKKNFNEESLIMSYVIGGL